MDSIYYRLIQQILLVRVCIIIIIIIIIINTTTTISAPPPLFLVRVMVQHTKQTKLDIFFHGN